ncbi:Ubiquinone Biosynthesis Monooxygenase Coq6, partial [Manis pentadactyla]
MFTVGMTDIEADGVGSDTLALWKDLGSGSDMMECKMLDQGYGEAQVTSSGQDTLALWGKDLGSGSDMTGSAKMVDQGYGEARVTSVVK